MSIEAQAAPEPRVAVPAADVGSPPPGRILLLLGHRQNRALLEAELAGRYQVIAEDDQALDGAFDLCIVDGPSLDRLWERVQRRKEQEKPAFLPVLLVTSRPDVRMITRHVWRSVDELIIAPVERAELVARVQVLLRARTLSLELRRQAEAAQELAQRLREKTTELETTAARLAERTAAAEEANLSKTQFLATMSHELRTPLNAIGGYVELLEMGVRGTITDLQRSDLARIQASQRHLLGLINEVLNYAKLGTGTVEYDVSDVSVAEALAAAEALVAPQAAAKGLTLQVADCAPGITARADAEKLRQVLANLLSNAVKFTEAGGRVEITCELEQERVLVQVRDTGIGIPTDKLENIFDPFVQVRSDLTRTAEGTGLGLAISRDLARGMGGDLAATSTPGAGSVFTLTLARR